MSDETKSPRRDSPASDGIQPGSEPARSVAPEAGESAPNQPSSKHVGKTGAARDRHSRSSKDTGALLSRITGILRRAAEEAPGDPVISSANAQPSTEPAMEKNFLESLHSQPRQGTGQLRIMVTGGPGEDKSTDETTGEKNKGPVVEASGANGNGTAAAGEDDDTINVPPSYPSDVTGRLNAPFTGVLRHNTDGLSELRAEIESEGQQELPESWIGTTPSASTGQGGRADAVDDMHLLDTLLSEQGSAAGEPQAARQDVADLMKQMWGDEPSMDSSSSAEDEARLEDRFALLGGDGDALAGLPVTEAAPEIAQPAVPHFDDAVMFPDEHTEAPFEEPGDPVETILSPAADVQSDEVRPPLASAAFEPPQPELESAPAPETATRGKGGKRTESIYEDLRQNLADEESAKRRRGTGGLLRRITGSLRRTTDSLLRGNTRAEKQSDLAQPESEEAQIPALSDAAAGQPLEPDFSDLRLDDIDEEMPGKPVHASADLAGFPEDALIAGLEPMAQAAVDEPEEEDWMAAIRQEDVEESTPVTEPPTPAAEAAEPVLPEPAPEERPRTITGKLAKIVTGILGGQAARKKTTKELDLPDEVVTGRLQRSMVTGPLNSSKTRELNPEELQELDTEQQVTADRLAAESALPEEETPGPQNRGITGQLRSLITGILRSSEPPGTTGPLQTGELPGGPSADRVEQGLPARPRSTPRRTSERRETFDAQSLRQDMIEDVLPSHPAHDISEEELLRGLGTAPAKDAADPDGAAGAVDYSNANLDTDLPEDRFGMLFGGDSIAEAYSPSGETGGLGEPARVTGLEDEAIGELSPEDIWGTGDNQPAEDARQPEETIWYVPEEAGDDEEPGKTGSLFEDQLGDDDLVSAFLSGQTGQLKTPEPGGSVMSAPDLRAIALENYGETPVVGAVAAERVPEAAAEARELEFEEATPARRSLWARITSLTVLQKILLVEVALLVILVPFLMFTALSAPKPEAPAAVFPMPNSLPAGVPHPTGLTLPGGWRFDLQKSTFVEGKWAPAGSEWLEGTEVRRVVALPWNKQTDAVVQTFQPGDLITLTLSNQDEVPYTITSVERRTSTEADFLADRKLSLVVLLYDEESEDRWVITSER